MENKDINSIEDTFLAKWLEGKLSDSELKQRVGEEAYLSYLKLRKGIEVSEKLNASTDATFRNIQSRIEHKKTAKVRKLKTKMSFIGVAATILICFGLFTILKDSQTIVETGFGETKTVTLIDGSEVVLNSKSKLTYDEDSWDEERLINLEGEAYFKVAKGKTFTVETDNGFVTVLGTQFNVISMNNLFDVVCYEGKVGVKTLDSQHVLMPSHSIRKIDTKPTQTLFTQLSSPTWISGESTYKSLPVRFVIKALENQYNIKIDAESIDDSVLFTGSFPNNDLKVALRTVFEPLDIKFDEKENRNIKLRY